MPFWQDKKLSEMSHEEWESVCDGCARCCLIKLEDEDDGEIVYTSMVCQYLDESACRCTVYPERHSKVRDCIDFTAAIVTQLQWLPKSCAYRRLAEGRDLAWWHPLVSGSQETVIEAGISVQGRVIDESTVHESQWAETIVHWVET